MPYLYEMAVKSHKTGIPMMKSMALAFGSDPAVDYLDRQYMLGDSLLVAPVFSEDGTVDYYLPTGTWTHLLTGEVKEGGRWYSGKYDYFSLPLYVKDGTILAMGKVDSRPDYDYTDGTTLRFYMSADGTAQCVIPDTSGNDKLVVKASRKGDTITVELPGGSRTVAVEAGKVAEIIL